MPLLKFPLLGFLIRQSSKLLTKHLEKTARHRVSDNQKTHHEEPCHMRLRYWLVIAVRIPPTNDDILVV